MIDYTKECMNISKWIDKVLKESGLKNLVIGLSGGVDSATVAYLAVKAVGPERVFVVMLPYKRSYPEGLADAQTVASSLAIQQRHSIVYDIGNAVDAVVASIHKCTEIQRGNIMARMRMIYLFDLAKKKNALVCGTENKSEYYLGYFTRFGDEASDIEPIRHLYKTQVWEFAKHLSVPDKIISKAPTAGLWENQTDEEEFGFSYKEADKVLRLYFDEKLDKDELIAKGISKVLVDKVLKRVILNEFKHHMPFVYKP